MKKLLFVLTASLFVFGKCNKTDETPSSDFLPLNTGTYWKYLTTNTTTTTTTSDLTLTVTGKDTAITNNGSTKTYKVLSSSAGANNYWAKVGSDYYRYGIIPGATLLGNSEELYLKDNFAVNGTWTNSFSVNYNSTTVPVTATYKIVAIDQSKTVTAGTSSNTFTGVTQVNVVFTTAVPFLGSITLGSGDFFYAKNIGLIAQSVNITANTTLGIAASSVKWDIQSYVIK